MENAYRILIVEDDRSQARFAESILRNAGMQTCWIGSAAELAPALTDFAPDLVLMDLHLPDGDGIALTARIRDDPAHAHLQIVFLSGEIDQEKRFAALDHGADDFLLKPIRPRHLIAAIRNRIMRARALREDTAIAAGVTTAPVDVVQPTDTAATDDAIGATAAAHDTAPAAAPIVDDPPPPRAPPEAPAAAANDTPRPPPDAPADRHAHDIRQALQTGRGLTLAFQPIVAIGGGGLTQFQARLRMRDQQNERHNAGVLIASARACGLLTQLDQWVMQAAVAALREQLRKQRSLRLFVSQSPEAIAADPDAQRLRDLLAEQAITADTLVIDLRLDDALEHSLALHEFCAAAQTAGVRFCLSDYRHGPEPKAMLQRLRPHYLRLRSPAANTGADGPAQLRDIIADAHASGLETIGGQVDTPAAAAALWTGGIDYIQGNLIHAESERLDFDFQHAAAF